MLKGRMHEGKLGRWAVLLPVPVLLAGLMVTGQSYAMRPVVGGTPAVASNGQRGGGRAPGYLGIEFHDMSDEQVQSAHVTAGRVEVVMVDHDGPAGKAGLRPHDVIVSVNGQLVVSADMLRRMIHDTGAGVPISLNVWRSGAQVKVTAQLATREEVDREALARMAAPEPTAAAVEDEAAVDSFTTERASGPVRGQSFLGSMMHSGPFTGMALQVMGPQLAVYFGAPMGMGLLVSTVAANSPAANAGCRAGDVVLRVDGMAMHTASDWAKRLHASKGRPMVLTVLRDKHEQTVTLVPAAKSKSAVEWPRFFERGQAFVE